MQDQAQSLRLVTGQAVSYVQTQRLYTKHSIPLARTDQEKDQAKQKLSELEQACVSHTMLHRMVNMVASALAQTSRDIKLLGDVMIKQIKLGEMTDVNPTDSPAVGREVTPAEMLETVSPAPTITVKPYNPNGSAVPFNPFESVSPTQVASTAPLPVAEGFNPFASSVVVPAPVSVPATTVPTSTPVPATTVSFDDPSPVVEAESLTMADRSAIPIESLFDELTGAAPAPAL